MGADIIWREIVEGSVWHADRNSRRAQVAASSGGCIWWIDGSGKSSDATDPEAARAAAAAELVRVGGPYSAARPEDAPRPSRPSLVSRIAAVGPVEVRAELTAKAERVGGFVDAVRELADEGGDPELVAVLHAEATGAAEDLAEAAVEVLRGLQQDLAIAEAVRAAHQADVDAARARVCAVEAQIEKVKQLVLRPACEAAGKGPTRALRLTTARVSICCNPRKVEIEEDFDARMLPEALQRVEIAPDKAAIKASIIAGNPVPGCFLVTTDRVEVR